MELHGCTRYQQWATNFAACRKLKSTLVWLVSSGLDGMLRLRTREEVFISMMTILVLKLALSTFVRDLTGSDNAYSR